MEDPAAPGSGNPPANGYGNGNGGGKGKPAAPKGRETFRSQRRESEGSVDCPTLEFEYGDTDGHAAELSELYSYTEHPEFTTNRRCFEEDFKTQVQGKEWLELEEDAQKAYVMGLLDRLEVVSRERRLKVARAVLYLAQGTFGECDSEVDVLHWSRYNCFLLYQMGTFSAFLELLHMEIDNSQACSSALRKPAISIADSTELRVLLSVMYLMVENIRLERETDSYGWRTARETFRTELSFSMHNEEPFALLLFSMVTKFCSGLAPHFPIKKVLLLLWKVVMFTLGGFEQLQALKVQKREELGLPPLAEDSIQVVKSMRAASPPSYTLDLGESQLAPPPSKLRGRRGSRRQLLTKQDSLDIYNERDLFKTEEPATEEEEESAGDGERTLDGELDLLEQDPLVPPPPSQAPLSAERVAFPKGLPWTPKVRQKDIEHFLEMSRNKFIGFTLGQDTDTLVGLPRPIHESVKTLKQVTRVGSQSSGIGSHQGILAKEHKYISIADVQIKNEEELEKCPMSLGEEVVPETPCEILYQGMLYSLPQYMIALLKILLAAAPTSKAKTDSINILADVLPEEMPITVLQSMKLGIDVNRHKEIIVKSISALLLLLLKHFKLNHIYQFEYVSQHLVFANCIPLILKFFNQNILSYITAKNSISVLDYPCCTIQDLPELTTESLEAGDNNQFCWRNLFSCINLLRLLNKLTKWKHSRTMMLVVFKSAPILKRALKVKQAMLQLYVLKLLKIQTKYLGRQWRKSNMKTMSAIYQKVRHRMNDDWAYGNDIDARPWDFQAEECTLRANIEAFNSRRYDRPQDSEFSPVDNCLQSVLGQRLDLPEDFHYSYELWLEREVFSQPICWEELLQNH
ncbi:striatin-interacting protein 2 isoform X1 [Globicephala melas]|uniref:striatin-interacting protein 2 isoform X1 n=1 Tax=Globicephala melas TaxID=9731 RepID=UPI00293D6774|nr:striatin-interacting protein 2 isoform X1 [Globicephala melas]